MPGPRNPKAKKKAQTKKGRKAKREKGAASPPLSISPPLPLPPAPSPPATISPPLPPLSESTVSPIIPPPPPPPLSPPCPASPPHGPVFSPPTRADTSPPPPIPPRIPAEMQAYFDSAPCIPSFLQTPCVEDLGDGPRVRSMRAFLHSRVCAPASREDALCAEFAQAEILEMLRTVLPEETAMMVWYNKSRLKSRVCPACKRLYHLGDAPREPLDGPDGKEPTDESTRRFREQKISGICSALCFILVAHKYPAAIRSTWGRMAEELSDEIWDELDAPGDDTMGLSTMLKMTRCHDLGLSQIFFSGDDGASESEGSEYGEEGLEPPDS